MNSIQGLKIGMITDWHLALQEQVGVYLDKDLAVQTRAKALDRMEEIANILEPRMPPVDLTATDLKKHTPPKRQFKKDGTPTVAAKGFFGKLKEVDGRYYSEDYQVFLPCHVVQRTQRPFRMKDQGALKDWLMEKGWSPTFWNYKKDKNNKLVRDSKGKLIQTSPKLQDKGNLCPNLDLLIQIGRVPEDVTLAIEWLSLRNRAATIKSLNEDKDTGYLNHERVIAESVLPASSAGVTNTLRQKHRGVVNVPSCGATLGEEFRSMFKSREGLVCVGYDASGLEARVEGHWTSYYQGGKEYAKELLEGDIHTKNAGFFYPNTEYDKDGKALPKFRNPSKAGKYALTYGSQAPTLASTLGISMQEAEEAYEAFWNGAKPLKALRDGIARTWKENGRKGIYCTLSGTFLHSRSEHSLVNLLFQHTGAFIMDVAGMFMDRYLGGITYRQDGLHYYTLNGKVVRRLVYYHDEYLYECNPEVADEVARLGVKSIIEAGKALNLNVPLDAEAKIGANWKDVH